MVVNRFRWVPLSFGVSAFLLSACASGTDSIAKVIRARYASLDRAYAAQNFDAVMALRHPDLEVVDPGAEGGIETYEQYAGLMRRWFAENKPPIDVRHVIESIEVRSPDEVAVRVVQRGSRYRGEGESFRHVVHEVRQRETWVRGASGWQVRKIDEIDLANRKVWVNGTPIPLENQ